MDDVEIRRLVAELDSAVPREGALLRFINSETTGNRAGFLRFGIEFLKAAMGSTEDPLEQDQDWDAGRLDLDYLMDPLSDIHFGEFERREDIVPLVSPGTRIPDVVAPVGCSVLFVLIFFLLVVGSFTILNWIAGWLFR